MLMNSLHMDEITKVKSILIMMSMSIKMILDNKVNRFRVRSLSENAW